MNTLQRQRATLCMTMSSGRHLCLCPSSGSSNSSDNLVHFLELEVDDGDNDDEYRAPEETDDSSSDGSSIAPTVPVHAFHSRTSKNHMPPMSVSVLLFLEKDNCIKKNNSNSKNSTLHKYQRKTMIESSAATAATDSAVAAAAAVAREEKAVVHRRGVVRFDLERNEDHDNPHDVYADECVRLWYQRKELARFKLASFAFAGAIARDENRISRDSSLGHACYTRVLTRVYQSGCCRNEQQRQQQELLVQPETSVATTNKRRNNGGGDDDCDSLAHWMSFAPDRLGLERWAARRVAMDIRMRQAAMLDLVLDVQDIQTSPDELEDKALFIRHSCERLSRPSRLFAQALAAAASCSLSGQVTTSTNTVVVLDANKSRDQQQPVLVQEATQS